MKKIVTIGGSTVDTFLEITQADSMKLIRNEVGSEFHLFASGEKIEIDTLLRVTGGGATNTAVSFKRLGFDVSCFSSIGNDPQGTFICEKLSEEDIDTKTFSSQKEHPTSTSYILHTSNLERSILVHRGASNYLSLESVSYETIEESSCIYLTSLSGESSKLLEPIVSHAKKHNVLVAVNPGSEQLREKTASLKKALSSIDILIMNAHEAKLFIKNFCPPDVPLDQPCLFDYPITHENYLFSLQRFFKEVFAMGPKTVVVTNGENGVYVGAEEKIFFHPSIQKNVIDTVGAGDSFGSAFVAQIVQGKDCERALRAGMIQSASVIEYVGAKAGLLSSDELEKRLQNLDTNFLKKFSMK